MNQKTPAVRVASESRNATFLLPNQMASMVSNPSMKSAVIIVVEPVFSELFVELECAAGNPGY